jgi:acyl-coenzyme A synthetase/AMP-(fatty) acid ligase
MEAPAIIEAGRTWTWRQIHEASTQMAWELGDAAAVCNLCSSRTTFLVTCLAAFRKRCLMILPSSGSNADITAALQDVARAAVVRDADDSASPAFEVPRDATHLNYRAEWKEPTLDAALLTWQPVWADVVLVLYTSGSTGEPVPQAKTMQQLVSGALVLGLRLDREVAEGMAAIDGVVCSVSPQHMFGLECSVMLPLVHGIPVLDRRPLLAADVGSALSTVHKAAWIATPLHLRNVTRSGQSLDSCSVVISSTMPLGPDVARQCEALVHAPVLEIYGSTETGAMAMRRTARECRWRPLEGVRIEAGSGGLVAHGSHFASPMRLLDDLLLEPDGSFTLLGRQADIVKVAGRRASLAGLNVILLDLPGLGDGVLYQPVTGNPAERLCLIYAGPALDRLAARRWLRARMDPVFLPRTLIRLERMPRDSNGKLQRKMLDTAYSEWQAAARGSSEPQSMGWAELS